MEEPSDAVLDLIHNDRLDQSIQVTALKVMLARSRDRCNECSPHLMDTGTLQNADNSDGSNDSDGSRGSGGSDHEEDPIM